MPNKNPPAGSTGSSAGRADALMLGALVLLAAALAAGYLDLRRNLTELRTEVGALRASASTQQSTLRLLRYEQRSKTGLGMEALLSQLAFWGEQFHMATTPAVERDAVKEHLLAVIDGMGALPAGQAWPRLERAFTESAEQDLQREWLLRAMEEIDAKAAAEHLERAVRGRSFEVSPRVRLFAARSLSRLDPTRAAAALREVLQTETSRGLDLKRIPPNLLAEHPDLQDWFPVYPGFWNFVDVYVATGDADTEGTLMMMLGRRNEHDLLTLQACVKALGKLGSHSAVKAIKDLFERPPPQHHPMFRNHCLDALAAIEGAAAQPYLQEALQREQGNTIRGKLTDLLKKTQG
ncbi:MAG: hypothetical protein AAF628_17185 [Planctomycetota bacterium]